MTVSCAGWLQSDTQAPVHPGVMSTSTSITPLSVRLFVDCGSFTWWRWFTQRGAHFWSLSERVYALSRCLC
jgi:hypothetical protein